jgi:hypothetical protein
VHIDVRRERAGLAAHFEQGDAGIDVRQVGAGLRIRFSQCVIDERISARFDRSVVTVRISAIPER